MPTIYVDDRPYEVEEGQNLLHACLSLGFDIPYFCWHPALHSVGSCRQCAVKRFEDEDDRQGEIVMACMTPAADGTRISIDDPDARSFRASVIEWLMVNHPHDCPVCDEGGECHLQDMTVMTGHNYRRYRFAKLTFRNQDLGPFINHEMNRCIECYRCQRFYRHYAGGRDLDVFGAHDRLFFGRQKDGTLQSEFSGNLVEICPTGVFTDKSLKAHYTRKWDLQTAPSVCVHCGLGCNTLPGERYGVLRRIHNRYHPKVNGYFLCDRGRFGYEFVNGGQRIRSPLMPSDKEGEKGAAAPDAALTRAGTWVAEAGRTIGIGSPRASLEANFALKTLVGAENFYAGLGRSDLLLLCRALEILRDGPVPAACLQETSGADAVLVLGEDLVNTAPMAALALRQLVRAEGARRAAEAGIPPWNAAGWREVVQDEKAPLFVATPCDTKLDDAAAGVHRAGPDDLARLGFAVAHCIDPAAPDPPGLDVEEEKAARRIADFLAGAKRPLVASGTSCESAPVLEAAANIAWALKARGASARIFLTVPECNSMGLGMLEPAGALEEAFERVETETSTAAVVLETDLFRHADPASVISFFEQAGAVVVVDHVKTRTADRADIILPSATFAEGTGTLVNSEGRAQRFFQVFVPGGAVRESWRWICHLSAAANRPEMLSWRRTDDVHRAMAEAVPSLSGVGQAAPGPDLRLRGAKIPRQSSRFSGRTAVSAHIDVHEPAPPQDPDTPLSFSMEGSGQRPPSSLITRYRVPGWSSVQALNRFQQEIGGPLLGEGPGRRLVEPDSKRAPSYFGGAPERPVSGNGKWRVLPLFEIFGSEELSLLSPSVAVRVVPAYVVLSEEDASELGVAQGDTVKVRVNQETLHLVAKIQKGFVVKNAGLARGLPGMPFFTGRTAVEVNRVEENV